MHPCTRPRHCRYIKEQSNAVSLLGRLLDELLDGASGFLSTLTTEVAQFVAGLSVAETPQLLPTVVSLWLQQLQCPLVQETIAAVAPPGVTVASLVADLGEAVAQGLDDAQVPPAYGTRPDAAHAGPAHGGGCCAPQLSWRRCVFFSSDKHVLKQFSLEENVRE